MALLTPMTLAQAAAIAAPFGLTVVAITPIPHGSVNSNFRLDLAGGGRAFLRVYEESDHAAVRAQNALLGHLARHGVPTPTALSAGGDTVATHRGKPVSLFAFCEGRWICQRLVDEARLERVGDALASIHLAGDGYRGAPPSRFDSAALRRRLDDLRSRDLSAELSAAVARLGGALDEVAAVALPARTIVHGDVFRDNVLWTDDGRLSAVLDFESAAPGHPAFDLMVTCLAWCFGDRLEQPLARALVRGYARRRPLPDDERAACYGQARAAAVRFAITRITDYELRPRDVVVYKDFRRFVARLDAVEAIGPAAFADWLSDG